MVIQTNSTGRLVSLMVIMTYSILVMLGHYLNFSEITQIDNDQVSMKLSTAFLFFLSSLLILLKKTNLFATISTMAICVALSMRHCGLECVFPNLDTSTIKSIALGFPSYATLISFFLVGFYPNKSTRKVIGCLLMGIGGVALFGYLIGIEYLYFYIEGHSTAMAILTAIFIFILGLIFVRDSKATTYKIS